MAEHLQISRILSDIRDLYETLRSMTVRFMDAFSVPALQNLLAERSLVLQRIDSEEGALRRISGEAQWKSYREFEEIRNTIASIMHYDRQIEERITGDMKAVKRELSSLSATTNAAIGYTRHLRG